MAEKHSITGIQEKNRRLALLALNAGKKSRVGDCPVSEEMATLLDQSCDRQQREKLLLHLNSCDACFQEWCELSAVLKAKK